MGRGAIISCHGGISEFGATTTFSETVATATFSEITATAAFLKWLPWQQNIGHHGASTEDWRSSWWIPAPKAIPYHAFMNCLRCLSLMMHPFDCAVVAFIRVISHLKYQVVSVLPSVAPSRHLSFRGAPWMHGYERLEKCEVGEVRPRSKITWLSWRSWQDCPELGTHASKDEQESHRDVIGKLAYRLKFTSSVMNPSMASNWNADLVSLTINYERYWFEWERTVELILLNSQCN